MANTKSAKKAIRSGNRKAVINTTTSTKYKKASKALHKAIIAKDSKTKVTELLAIAYKQIDKAAKKSVNIISRNKAARLNSYLALKTQTVS